MNKEFEIRRATPEDAAVIARHRALMFQDMGELSPEAAKLLQAKAEPLVEAALREENYLGWLARVVGDPKKSTIAGAGLQMNRILPRPLNFSGISEGRQGVIVNVYTEPVWRKRGLATSLIKEILQWSKQMHFDRILLHASREGRSVYQKLGFVESNEMRFVGKQ